MAIIPLRSPRFESLITPASAISAKMELTIDTVLRYTIIKDCTETETVTFEIAELCRDYIEPLMWEVAGFPYSSLPTVAISRAITFYDDVNATGSIVQYGGADTNTVAYDGFEGYGDYMEGANWEIPEGATNAFLLSKNPSSAYEIFMPEDTVGWIIGLNASEEKGIVSFSTSDTTKTNRSSTCTITRVDCSKYTPSRIWFVNKLGAIQELYFFTKEVEVLKTNKQTYQRNTIDTSAETPSYFRPKYSTYDTFPHPITTFSKNGRKSYTLSSGYYPEWANTYFEQLMLSEYVWIYKDTCPVSVQLKTSSMSFKTQINDKLIEYTMSFEEAFDTINDVR